MAGGGAANPGASVVAAAFGSAPSVTGAAGAGVPGERRVAASPEAAPRGARDARAAARRRASRHAPCHVYRRVPFRARPPLAERVVSALGPAASGEGTGSIRGEAGGGAAGVDWAGADCGVSCAPAAGAATSAPASASRPALLIIALTRTRYTIGAQEAHRAGRLSTGRVDPRPCPSSAVAPAFDSGGRAAYIACTAAFGT